MNIFDKNPLLAWFGLAMLLLFFIELGLSAIDKRELTGVNIWIKPMKFSLATVIFVWTLAWILTFIDNQSKINVITWIVIFCMSIEIILIVFQAIRGEKSHFNISTPLNSAIFSIMGTIITINTIAIGFLTVWFFTENIEAEPALVWSIRLGLFMFVLFSLEGFVMGGMLKHSVGTADGGKGLFFLNWNVNAGDLRVAHFIGIHALQIVPIFAIIVLKLIPEFRYNLILVLIFSLGYFSVSTFAFVRAMQGKPLLF